MGICKNIRRIVLFCTMLVYGLCFTAYGAGQDMNIRFSKERMTLGAAFSEIESQTDLTVAYNEEIIDVDRSVSIPASSLTLREALSFVLDGTGTDFIIRGKQIVIMAKNTPDNRRMMYHGVVSDDNGEPVAGAMVNIKGTTDGLLTDGDGCFSISAVEGQVLEISFLGFKTGSIVLGQKVKLDFTLEPDYKVLDEVVVIGYGQMHVRDITTAISVVSTEDIDSRPMISAASALQGRAAGVYVVQPSGMPGTSLSVRVRGATSVQASNEPLYVVDGIPTDDISFVSPDDIFSLQVLKDASSSAIYGARAANGVVIINTKRGSAGKATVKFNGYVGFSQLGKTIDALDTEQYKELMKELSSVTSTVPYIPEDEHRYTNWTDELFDTGLNQNYQLSLSNGNERIRYFVSAGHTREKGIVNKAYFRRTNMRANVDSDMFSWLSMGLNVAFSHNKGRSVYENRSSMRAGSILSVINTPPFMQKWDPENPGQYDEDAYGSRILNPLAANAADMTSRTDRFVGSLSLDFKPFKGFNFKSSYSVDLPDSSC